MKRRFMSTVPQAAGLGLLLAALTAPSALASGPIGEQNERGRAAATTAGQQRSRAPVDVVLTSITPHYVGAKDIVKITGYVRNRSGQQLSGLAVRLRYRSTPMNSRAELQQWSEASAPTLPGNLPPVPITAPLNDGAGQDWQLKTSAKNLGIDKFGVYPIAVEVVNTATGATVAFRPTTLVFNATGRSAPKPTKIAVVWPLIDRPHRATDTTFFDDKLQISLQPGGRLAGLVAAASKAENVPITWAVDPALLDDVREMAGGYTVRTFKNAKQTSRTVKPTSQAARRWLADLRAATGDDPYFAVPYADPDPVPLIRNKMRKHLTLAYKHSAITQDKDLLNKPAMAVAWPAAGTADQPTLDQIARLDKPKTAFMIDSRMLPSTNQMFTVGATTRLEADKSRHAAVAYDATLSQVISNGTKNPATALLAEQRFLAETAMITAEQPNLSRTVVIAPERRWNPDPDFAARLLGHLGSSGKGKSSAAWMKATPLRAVLDATPQNRVFTGYPSTIRRSDLPMIYLQKVRGIAAKAGHFSTIFTPPTNTYERTILRTESSYWREHNATAIRIRDIIRAELDRDIGNIKIVSSRKLGLAGNSGIMPVTVANDLKDRTVTVRLRVTSMTEARLKVGKPDPEQVTLGPGDKETAKIPLQAFANGNTDVVVELQTTEGEPFGQRKLINVRTTGYGRTALLITGGGLAVLFLGVGLRVLRAKRRHRAEATRDGQPAAGQGASPDDATAGPDLDHGAASTSAASGSGSPESASRSASANGTYAPFNGTTSDAATDRADGRGGSPVPSTSGTDAASTGSDQP